MSRSKVCRVRTYVGVFQRSDVVSAVAAHEGDEAEPLQTGYDELLGERN